MDNTDQFDRMPSFNRLGGRFNYCWTDGRGLHGTE